MIFSFITSVFKNIKKFLQIYKYPCLSGLLFGWNFIPAPFFVLFFALTPLWLFIYQQTSFKRVLMGCFLCQFITSLIGFNWLVYTFHSFGGMNGFASFILYLLFCCIANIYMVFSGGIWFILTKKSSFPLITPAKLILFPLLFSLFQSLIPTVFPWNMGYPWFWGNLPGAQTAELWGFRFLNTLFYIFNLLFLILFQHRFDGLGKTALAGIAALFLFLNGLGLYLKQRLPKEDKTLNVLLIQNNIGSIPHLDPYPFSSSAKKAFHISRDLTYRAISKYTQPKEQQNPIHFILWSEGSYGYSISKRAKQDPLLSNMVKNIQIPLITGAFSRDLDQTGRNSLFVFDRQGNILHPIYDKIKLLIFGEYFPGINHIPFLRKIFPYFGREFSPGQDILVQELEGTHLGWQICYESLFDQISRDTANKNAQVLVNITNDSWYGSWQEPWQHLNIALSRSIELRRPFLRATNTGYSGVAHANGTIAQLSPLNKSWFNLYKIPYYENPKKTLFMSWGFYINEIFLSCLVLFVLVISLQPRLHTFFIKIEKA